MVKIGLVVLGSMFSFLTVLLVWGIQKLASTLFGNTTAILQLTSQIGTLEKDIAIVKRDLDRVDKNERDLNVYFQRLKVVEEKLEE